MQKILEKKFWEQVEKKGPVLDEELGPCWIWTGNQYSNGYGYFWTGSEGKKIIGTRAIGAHRFSWFLKQVELPRLWVLHKCDNPSCVRPAHLYEGNGTDNSRDRLKRGRGIVALSLVEIKRFQNLWSAGQHLSSLSKQFQISEAVLSRLLRQ